MNIICYIISIIGVVLILLVSILLLLFAAFYSPASSDDAVSSSEMYFAPSTAEQVPQSMARAVWAYWLLGRYSCPTSLLDRVNLNARFFELTILSRAARSNASAFLCIASLVLLTFLFPACVLAIVVLLGAPLLMSFTSGCAVIAVFFLSFGLFASSAEKRSAPVTLSSVSASRHEFDLARLSPNTCNSILWVFNFDDNALAKRERVVSVVVTIFFLTLLPSYLKAGGGEVQTSIMIVVLYLAVELAICMAKFAWDRATERSAFSEAVLLRSLQNDC